MAQFDGGLGRVVEDLGAVVSGGRSGGGRGVRTPIYTTFMAAVGGAVVCRYAWGVCWWGEGAVVCVKAGGGRGCLDVAVMRMAVSLSHRGPVVALGVGVGRRDPLCSTVIDGVRWAKSTHFDSRLCRKN